MSVQWFFEKLTPRQRDRQPTVGEFFATDAISSLTEALVRESIQNSLDAKVDHKIPVKVRFHVGKTAWSTSDKYFKEAWPHFLANDNGLDLDNLPRSQDECGYLVVEDFNTTGLCGDVLQWDIPDKKTKNPFYYFFRAEGRSGKGEQDRGRWGIGKYVFPRVSKIKSFIALTVRADDGKRLLMGQSILKSHKVKGVTYTPDANYGEERKIEGDNIIVPVDDKNSIDDFCKSFSLKRTVEPGLSVLVPWVHEVSAAILLRSVVEDYFYPILDKELIVTVSSDEGETIVDATSLFDVAKKVGSDFEKEMSPLLKLAEWARAQMPEGYIELLPSDGSRPELLPTMLDDALRKKIQSTLNDGACVAIKVPLGVREKGKPDATASHFDIFLAPAEGEECRPVYIREGIIISDVRGKIARGVRSIVVIHDSPLAKLLGDSENPAHTQWQRDRDGFKGKYVSAPKYIECVANSVATIMRFINEADQKPDTDLLRDLFFLETEEDKLKKVEDVTVPKKKDGEETPTPVIKIPRKPLLYSVERIKGGFVLKNSSAGPEEKNIQIEMAYDRRSGNPLRKWTEEDFELDKKPVSIKSSLTGVSNKTCSGNKLSVTFKNPKAWIRVTGFDENRDLYIDTRTVEVQP